MTIEEFIPKINDKYTDAEGYLHIDINLPADNGENNFVLMEQFHKENKLKPRIRELCDLSDYEYVTGELALDCYFKTVWKLKR